MKGFYSFLQTAYHFVKSLTVNVTKKMYRTAVVLITALAVVTVVTFNSGSFSGAGKSAAAAIHEDNSGEEELPDVLQSEEDNSGASVLSGGLITTSNEQSQRLVGSLMEQDIQDDLAKSAVEVETIDKEVLMQAQQAQAEAEEKAGKGRFVISCSDSDYEVLTRIVQAEAGICDDEGKILVANVIINRVRNGNFPDNITDVVYAKSQFSPVMDGSINTCRVTQQTIDCVNRALAGEDYSQGALYFMNRGGSDASNVRWFDKRLTFVLQHGRHEFFK